MINNLPGPSCSKGGSRYPPDTYPLGSDLSGESRYRAYEQLGPVVYTMFSLEQR